MKTDDCFIELFLINGQPVSPFTEDDKRTKAKVHSVSLYFAKPMLAVVLFRNIPKANFPPCHKA